MFNIDDDGQPVIRKASAHGLGHWRAPYGSDNPAAGIPLPRDSLSNIGVEHWQHDLWWQIVWSALDGEADRVRLDYHPTLERPAVSRYGATSPNLLRWFAKFNRGRDYRDQVKPFNFMLAPSAGLAEPQETIAYAARRSRRKRSRVKPIAPFDRDHTVALTSAFDRETGEPVSADELKTYAAALAQYHLHPEAKFRNGDYLDRGTTLRRHVRVTATRQIGKEAADWERQAALGWDDEAQPDYGFSEAELARLRLEASALVERIGVAATAEQCGLTSGRVKALAAGSAGPNAGRITTNVAARLTDAARNADAMTVEREQRLEELRQRVEENGLRVTAREIGIDPSNLRRKLRFD